MVTDNTPITKVDDHFIWDSLSLNLSFRNEKGVVSFGDESKDDHKEVECHYSLDPQS